MVLSFSGDDYIKWWCILWIDGDHGIHCRWELIRSKQLSSVSVCRVYVFTGFSGHGNSIHNIIPLLKKKCTSGDSYSLLPWKMLQLIKTKQPECPIFDTLLVRLKICQLYLLLRSKTTEKSDPLDILLNCIQ